MKQFYYNSLNGKLTDSMQYFLDKIDVIRKDTYILTRVDLIRLYNKEKHGSQQIIDLTVYEAWDKN